MRCRWQGCCLAAGAAETEVSAPESGPIVVSLVGPPHAESMHVSKSDDQKLAALARKNAAKAAAKPKATGRRQYDSTLPPEADEDIERRNFFSEMKKREF